MAPSRTVRSAPRRKTWWGCSSWGNQRVPSLAAFGSLTHPNLSPTLPSFSLPLPLDLLQPMCERPSVLLRPPNPRPAPEPSTPNGTQTDTLGPLLPRFEGKPAPSILAPSAIHDTLLGCNKRTLERSILCLLDSFVQRSLGI